MNRSIEPLTIHDGAWRQMNRIVSQNRLTQAWLMLGPRHAGIGQFINRLMAQLMCAFKNNAPCGQCQSCLWLQSGMHPDVVWLSPESPGKLIGIEEIRCLQSAIEKQPVFGAERFIVMDTVHALNLFSANALLKMLEEPPLHTRIFLIAEHLSGVLPTLVSRCQRFLFTVPDEEPVLTNFAELVDDWCAVLEGKKTVCSVSSQYTTVVWADLLHFLYQVLAYAIRHRLTRQPIVAPLKRFSELMNPVRLFHCMDVVMLLIKKHHEHVSVNQRLAIEAIFTHDER